MDGADFFLADRDQVVERDRALAAGVEEADGLAQAGAVEGVADGAGVGEVGLAHAVVDVVAEGGAAGLVEAVALLLQHGFGDGHELVRGVVGEVDVVGDAGAEAGVGGEELVHAVRVAGEDDDEVVAAVLHDLEEDLDGFLAVVALVFGAEEVVGLVDEEDAAHGFLEDLLGLGGGVADVLADEVVAGDGDEVAGADVAEAVQDAGHAGGDGGLAGAGVAGEGHVQRGSRRGQAELAAEAVDEQEGGDLADAALDRGEADQLAIELVEHGAYAGGVVGGLEVDRAGRFGVSHSGSRRVCWWRRSGSSSAGCGLRLPGARG